MSNLALDNLNLLAIVRLLADDSPCRLNELGDCEAHRWTWSDSHDCPHGQAQRFMAAHEARLAEEQGGFDHWMATPDPPDEYLCSHCGRPRASDEDFPSHPNGRVLDPVCFREHCSSGGALYEQCERIAIHRPRRGPSARASREGDKP